MKGPQSCEFIDLALFPADIAYLQNRPPSELVILALPNIPGFPTAAASNLDRTPSTVGEDRRDADVVGPGKVSCRSFAKLGGIGVASRRLYRAIPLNRNGEAHNGQAHDPLLWNTSL